MHFAIKKPDASGKAVNTLEVQVAPTAVSYLVNGAVVDATPTRAAIREFIYRGEKIGGIVGVRIDDQIDVQVDSFFFESPFSTERARTIISGDNNHEAGPATRRPRRRYRHHGLRARANSPSW